MRINRKIIFSGLLVLLFIISFTSEFTSVNAATMGDLSFSAQKSFTLKSSDFSGSRVAAMAQDTDNLESNFDQSFDCRLKGLVTPGFYTEFFYDDQEDEKLKRIFLKAEKGDFVSKAGDLSLDLKNQNFLLRQKDIRGFSVSANKWGGSAQVFTAKVKGKSMQDTIRGNNTDGPYILSKTSIIHNSDIVRINDRVLSRNIEYTIDYFSGTMSFNPYLSSSQSAIVSYDYEDEFSNSDRYVEGVITSLPMGKKNECTISFLRKRDALDEDVDNSQITATGGVSKSLYISQAPLEHQVLDIHQKIELGPLKIEAEMARSYYDSDSRIENEKVNGSALDLKASLKTAVGQMKIYRKQIGQDFIHLDKASTTGAGQIQGITFASAVDLMSIGKVPVTSSFTVEGGDPSNTECITTAGDFFSIHSATTIGTSRKGLKISLKHIKQSDKDAEYFNSIDTSSNAGAMSLNASAKALFEKPGVPGMTKDVLSMEGQYEFSRKLRASMNLDGYSKEREGDSAGGTVLFKINASPTKKTRVVTNIEGSSESSSLTGTYESSGEIKVIHKAGQNITLRGVGRVLKNKEKTDQFYSSDMDISNMNESLTWYSSLGVSMKPKKNITTSLNVSNENRERIEYGIISRPVNYGTSLSVKYTPFKNMNILSKYNFKRLDDGIDFSSGKEEGVSLNCSYKPSKSMKVSGGLNLISRLLKEGPANERKADFSLNYSLNRKMKLKSAFSIGRLDETTADWNRVTGDLSLDYRAGKNMTLSIEYKYQNYDDDDMDLKDYGLQSGKMSLSMKI